MAAAYWSLSKSTSDSGQKAVACLLPPNQDTLRHIALGSPWEDEAAVDLLSSLPHLTSLELDLGPSRLYPPKLAAEPS
eukprot:EC834898.1.p3 GENE.EC834898.1~~EC834898.1.p3  ORF type:complete len:78 (+),score=3.25 EC834898.1:59-292(+)